MLAGLGIFLFGMFQLENAMKQLAGRTFKLFLQKHTENKLGAIFSGTLVTAVLQSSSVVNIMVLSFVGAGVISMRNALAVVFGSNLGTTLDSWVVAMLGFKFDIEKFALPIIAIAGIGLIAFANRKKLYHVSNFLMGFGLLFLGLHFMKGSMESLLNDFDFKPYIHLGKLSFVLLGFIITAIIQSSSATMVITLSALNTGAIPFDIAAAIIIGSELGTSIKTALGAIGGIAAKRRVALGNIIFNFVITFLAFLFMGPIIELIKFLIGIKEPLISLVLFQTIINLCGIILFFPFLKKFSDFLENRFTKNENTATYYIQNVSPKVPELALEVLQKETLLFIQRVISLNMEAFHVEGIRINFDNKVNDTLEKNNKQLGEYIEKYENVKHAEGEIIWLYTQMNEEPIEKEDFIRLNQLMSSIRNAMYSAKGIKDIRHNRKDLSESANNIKYEHYIFLKSQLYDFYLALNNLLTIKKQSDCFEMLQNLMEQLQKDYETRMNNIYKLSAKNTLEEMDVSSLLNISREVYSSGKALVFSVKDYLLDTPHAEDFENIPVAIIT